MSSSESYLHHIPLSDSIGSDSILFSNLLLLGFDPHLHEQKYNLTFHKDMFKNTNIKGMEIIMHYLFQKLDPKRAEKDFQLLFPVSDKKQRTTFRTVAMQWLKEMKDRGSIYILNLQPTLLQSAYGENLYTLLLQLSTHALKIVFERDHAEYLQKSIPKSFFSRFEQLSQLQETKAAKNVIMLHIRNQTRKLIECARVAVDKQEKWQDLAQNLTNEYKDIIKQEAELDTAEKEFNRRTDSSLFSESNSVYRENQLDNVASLFKRIELHHQESGEMREIVNDVASGQDIRMKIFKEDITKENPSIHFDKFVSNYGGRNKLNLPLMVDNWTKQLSTLQTLMKHHTIQSDITTKDTTMSAIGQRDAPALIRTLDEESKKQQQYLNSTSKFSKEVSNLVNKMETNIEKVRKQIDINPPKKIATNSKYPLIPISPKRAKFTNSNENYEKYLLPQVDEEQMIQEMRISIRNHIRGPNNFEQQPSHHNENQQQHIMIDETATAVIENDTQEEDKCINFGMDSDETAPEIQQIPPPRAQAYDELTMELDDFETFSKKRFQ